MSGRLEGKVAFITGAARGQGRSHAVRLAEEGADIIAIDICAPIETVNRTYPAATPEDLAQTRGEVEALGRRIVTREADVRDIDAVQAAVSDGVGELGRLDIVCANAGVFVQMGAAHTVGEQEWADVVDVNLTGVWHTCKAAVPTMIAHGEGGSVILTSSTAGIKAPPHLSAYAAAKHGVIGLMKSMVMELAQYRIRVNTVLPTGVDTLMIQNEAMYRLYLPDADKPTREDAAIARVFASTNALPIPWVDPVDVSNAVLFLASDESRYITGTELKVDAGYTIR